MVVGFAPFACDTDGTGLGLRVIVPEACGLVGAELARVADPVRGEDGVGTALVFGFDGVELVVVAGSGVVGVEVPVLVGREVEVVGVGLAARAEVPATLVPAARPSARISGVR
jgi:hypothetical protein